MNMKRSLHALLVVVIAAVSTSVLANNTWNNYHWARDTSSFSLKVIDSVTSDWRYPFDESMARWSSTSVLDLAVVSVDAARKTRKRCKMVRGQMHVCNAAYGANGWLGMASIYLDGSGHIVQGSAKMNDSYNQDATERNHVMCQEIGHVLGLDHTTEDGSSQSTCMDYSSSVNSQWPNQHDYDTLLSLYGHTDSYNSYDDSAPDGGGDGGGGGGCNAPPGRGCNKNTNAGPDVPPMGVRVHRGERHEIWVAPGRHGGLWIHHIYLATGEH